MQLLHRYRAFGLEIDSDIELFQLQSSVSNAPIDLSIRSAVDYKWMLGGQGNLKLEFKENSKKLRISVDELASFLVLDGRNITVYAEHGVDFQSVNLYLLGSCLGAALHQRNQMVLHGTSIRVGDRAVVIVAPSGYGKSTLAGEFCRRRYQILTDDVCVIDKASYVQPSYPYLKLWEDTVNALGFMHQDLVRIRLQENKFYCPLGESFCNISLPVAGVYILNTHEEDDFNIQDIYGADKLKPLKRNTYRPIYVKQMSLHEIHLQNISTLGRKAWVADVWRPSKGFQITALADRLIEDMSRRGLSTITVN